MSHDEPESTGPAPSDDDGWLPDPDAPPTDEGKREQAVLEMQRLLLASLQATGLGAALLFTVDLVRGVGFALTKGFVLGALLASLNLWLLASGILQLARGPAATLRGFVTLSASFVALVLCAAWVVFFERGWTVGFALGLAIPALGGLLYARVRGGS